jgi:CDP-glycerol glycerophosphotransferase (TagB/SpsB family)/GT2 family glycosyltransferase/glycosyltransferase involved in cell wall biosynthesis
MHNHQDDAAPQSAAHEATERLHSVLLEQVLPLLNGTERVLEINCAEGQFSQLLAGKVAHVTAIDADPARLQQARNNAQEAGLSNLEFSCADGLAYVASEEFDAVCLFTGLSQVTDDLQALRVLLRAVSALKDNGLLILGEKLVADGAEPRLVQTSQGEVKYRNLAGYVALSRSLGLQLLGQYSGAAQSGELGSGLYVFQLGLPKPLTDKISAVRVACYASMPFHFRSLRPLAECFSDSLLSLSIDEVMAWRPDVIAVADGWSVEFWRDYCDAHNVQLIGMRHGSVTRYGYAEPQYNCADFMCGSEWDIEDTLLSNVRPRQGFLLTGNSWVDQVFRLPKREPNPQQPTIVFAPTYNPQISAAVFFGERVVSLIRQVYPQARIIIKPHPAIVQHEHSFVVDKALFRDLMATWREQAANDPLLELVDDPEASIADSFAEADILLADRSSLLFEFMTLDRPILLYSSEKRIEHWQYNADAPGNAWRDIGLEFQDDKSFLALLADPYTQHAQHCREAQRARTRQLYNRFADGQSVRRVAAAIAALPRLRIVVDGRHTANAEVLAQAFADTVVAKDVALLGDGPALPGIQRFADTTQWLAASGQRENDPVLLVDARQHFIPGSAHQLSAALQQMARGLAQAYVFTPPSEPAADVPQPSAQSAAGWVLQRLTWAINSLQQTPAWTLLNSADFAEQVQALPAQVDDDVLDLWWQTLTIGRQPQAWDSTALNVTLGSGALRVVGKQHYLLCQQAQLSFAPAVVGVFSSQQTVRLQVAAVKGQAYDQFPFSATININGEFYAELIIADESAQLIELPYRPDAHGRTQVEVTSTGAFSGMAGIADRPVSLAMLIEVATAEGERVAVQHDEAELLQQWLDARLPTPIQNHLINDYLQAHQGGPKFAILILDLAGDITKLMQTITSLGLDNGLYATLQIIALTSAQAPVTAKTDKLHFVPVDAYGYVDAINQVVAEGEFDWLMLVEAGDVFTPSGLMVAALELIASPDCRAIYGDELQRLPDGRLGAAFRPGFNLDLLLSLPAVMAKHWLFRRDQFLSLGGFDRNSSEALEFDLLLRLINDGGTAGLGHIDEALVVSKASVLQDNAVETERLLSHLHGRGYSNAAVSSTFPGRYSINYGHTEQPLVSIIIPTKDQLPTLQRCVESLLEKTQYPYYEVLIVDNNSETAEAKDWLNSVASWGESRIRVLRYPQPFNYSAINNMAAAQAQGEYLVLLNNDTAILREDWLDALLNHALRPEVGVVGAKLLYPDGNIQHAGVVLGLRGPADHPFIGEAMNAPGYMQRLQVDQNYSAVTAACLMIRKSLYEEVGGLDEELFKVSYNDVDLCLKTRQAGYLTVWTPNAVVMHEGSVSQTRVDTAAQASKRKRFVAEQDALYEKWLPLLARDPAYNQNLSLNHRGFELEPDVHLTWRPLTWKPLPVVLAHPADAHGCGHYRIIRPFKAQKEAGLLDGMMSAGLLHVADLERYNPDVIVLQRQIGDERLEAMRRIKKFSQAFKVYELDDYLPNLPLKNAHRAHMPKDILKSLRKGLSFVDRFVVSTAPLAEAFAGLHGDIRVIENRLPPEWWDGLKGLRRQGRKPRVGWAGGISHTGDLELIADVVKALANEVEWVFFGMCPEKIRPYVHEYYSGVDIDSYPRALSKLNLDLALAPVEQNLFNECKSNLRLLEYGACGVPVVCSDLSCYRGDLPVTRVKNRYKDWVEAIRAHISDLDAAAKLGDALHEQVLRDWMLRDANVEAWRDAWLPG